MEYKYIGKNLIRADGPDKITGRAEYAADFSLDGMLHVAVARAEKAHAKILSIDTSAVPADVFVFTADDLAANEIVDIINDRPVLAKEKVRFMGEPIAVTAAKTREKAVQAARSIRAEYEELPVLLTPREALADGAVPIHEKGNLIDEFSHVKGDPDRGFAEADLIVGHTFSVPQQEHGYIEPDASFSYMDGDTMVVRTASQDAFHDRAMIAHALGLPEDKVHVISATVGGGFGGKDGHMTQIFGALVTQKTGRPAKLVFDRTETIGCTYKRHSAELNVRMGFKKDGTMTAFDGEALIDTGAYIGFGLTVLALLSEHLAGPYKTPNVRIRSRLVYTNKTAASAFRGFGAPQGAFATESVISEAAVKLGLDQIAIRRMNALETGDTGGIGQTIDRSCGMKEALALLEKTPLWRNRDKEKDPDIGYGLAAGHLSCGFGKSIPDTADVELEKMPDGIYEFRVGLTEIGQGANGSMTAIAAEALGVSPDRIRLVQSDTGRTYSCGSTAASRSTFIGGNAVLNVIKQYKEREAAGETDIVARDRASFPESRESLIIGMPHAMYTFFAQAVRVHVDPDTGCVRVLDAVAATEAGRVINPMQLNGQMYGGSVQSTGYALMEGCRYAPDGKMMNDTFSTYLIPTMTDAPRLVSLTVDGYEETGPYGMKGAAEASTVSMAAAINAAVFDATGKWHRKLPITPEEVLLGGEEADA